ncbi:hypothetical protein SKAU_G00133550 [Synaphobranchus kaupii]|uniref:Uncharacterized protein n=1 Tax=Synaphobranchus kaupii TaxID=118154 RepID=A0A9Q1FR50_SYNKA|nr:hypothetical protein SKAU_G00133550 [Synaphobranchus kaupii]
MCGDWETEEGLFFGGTGCPGAGGEQRRQSVMRKTPSEACILRRRLFECWLVVSIRKFQNSDNRILQLAALLFTLKPKISNVPFDLRWLKFEKLSVKSPGLHHQVQSVTEKVSRDSRQSLDSPVAFSLQRLSALRKLKWGIYDLAVKLCLVQEFLSLQRFTERCRKAKRVHSAQSHT